MPDSGQKLFSGALSIRASAHLPPAPRTIAPHTSARREDLLDVISRVPSRIYYEWADVTSASSFFYFRTSNSIAFDYHPITGSTAKSHVFLENSFLSVSFIFRLIKRKNTCQLPDRPFLKSGVLIPSIFSTASSRLHCAHRLNRTRKRFEYPRSE